MLSFNKTNQIYYEFKKKGEGNQTIIFIHGITGSSSAWKRYYCHFYKLGFNVLKFDLRGHGLSIKKNNSNYYKIENIAKDLFNLIKENNIETPIFITHSFGTFVLLEFIKNYPQYKISKIIFISLVYKLDFNNFSKNIIKLGTFLPIFRKIGIQIDYSKYFKNTKDYTPKRVIIESLNTNLKVISSLFDSIRHSKYFKIFSTINCPVLLIHGREDTISNYNTSIQISKEITKSSMKIYENLDHIIVLNNYDDIISDLDEFIVK